ncbi:MAG: HD domain-containing protein [Amphritea sp.]|nr:HD domain-containing protein [Amphritea sp.]
MAEILKQIEEIYSSMGHNQYGEGITQTEHGVQCARLAQEEGERSDMVVAALLHDIGHLVEEISSEHGNFKHDKVGAEYLAPYFPPGVTEPIRLHAQAKRYLCTVESGYIDSLSEASKYSLEHQGGLMSEDEVTAFRAEPFYQQAIKLRRWDDEGKDPELTATPFSDFKEDLESALNY